MRNILICRLPDSDFHDYVFLEHIIKVKEIGPNTCIVVVADGMRYTFEQPAMEVVQAILDAQMYEETDEDEGILPGTDTIQ